MEHELCTHDACPKGRAHLLRHGAGKVGLQALHEEAKRPSPCVACKVRGRARMRSRHPRGRVAQMGLARHRPDEQLHHVRRIQLLRSDAFVADSARHTATLLLSLAPRCAMGFECLGGDDLVRVLRGEELARCGLHATHRAGEEDLGVT